MVARERSEPNSEPPHGGGSVVARCVSAGYPDEEILEPRLRGGRERVNGIDFCHRIRVYIKLYFSMKPIPQTAAFCRPSPGAPRFLHRDTRR